MKRNPIYKPQPQTIVILTAFAAGPGIAVHKVFFLFTAAIALSVPLGHFIDKTREAEQKSTAQRQRA